MTTIPVIIDRSSPVPLYHQLAEQLTAVIEDGTLKPGDAFENELALADRLDLSRPTVRRAIAELVGRGLLVRRRGVGTTVANQVIHRRDELTSLYDDLDRRGSKPTTTILAFDPARVDARAAAAMGLPADTPLREAMVHLAEGKDPILLTDEGRVMGMLTDASAVRALIAKRADA